VRELILGGQRSGKSAAAERRAAAWLQRAGAEATLIATALAGDAEMRARIARHRADRVARVPAMRTVEAPTALPEALLASSRADRLVVIDCLTLWLTNLLMPLAGPALEPQAWSRLQDELLHALRAAPGPWVIVSNEIGLGLTPLSSEARRYVDALGQLHQRVAAISDRVTLMVAGRALTVPEEAA
jgi:adenosylcobinamide kinase/adenosylcobinamide-phosphate guanylyltransferase